MISFTSSRSRAGTLKITRQSIVRDSFSLSRLQTRARAGVATYQSDSSRTTGNSNSNSFRALRPTHHRHLRSFSHLRKAHSTSLASTSSSRTPNSCRFYSDTTTTPSRSGLDSSLSFGAVTAGMTISKSTAAEIIKSLPDKYTKATESGDLLFFPSTTTVYEENGVEVC